MCAAPCSEYRQASGTLPLAAGLTRLAAIVLASFGLTATAARAVTCPATSIPDAPIASSSSHHYFFYKGKTIPLLGLSHEYICHISQSDRQDKYCALENYKPQVFPTLNANKNNVIRLWAILNNSPGKAVDSQSFHVIKGPYPNEQPVLWNGSKWDILQDDPSYLTNLETVVCEAYNQDIIVELTLLDPWCDPWPTSAFNKDNTVSSSTQGFTLQK